MPKFDLDSFRLFSCIKLKVLLLLYFIKVFSEFFTPKIFTSFLGGDRDTFD